MRGGIAITGGNGGVADLKIVTIEKTASFSLAIVDTQKTIAFDIGGVAADVTLPLEATTSIPVGSWIVGRKKDSADTADVGIIKEGAQTFNTPLGNTNIKLDSDGTDGASFFAEKIDTDTWNITGTIKA